MFVYKEERETDYFHDYFWMLWAVVFQMFIVWGHSVLLSFLKGLYIYFDGWIRSNDLSQLITVLDMKRLKLISFFFLFSYIFCTYIFYKKKSDWKLYHKKGFLFNIGQKDVSIIDLRTLMQYTICSSLPSNPYLSVFYHEVKKTFPWERMYGTRGGTMVFKRDHCSVLYLIQYYQKMCLFIFIGSAYRIGLIIRLYDLRENLQLWYFYTQKSLNQTFAQRYFFFYHSSIEQDVGSPLISRLYLFLLRKSD